MHLQIPTNYMFAIIWSTLRIIVKSQEKTRGGIAKGYDLLI
uniref:Uncharacterized protein n=1 Tax=Rhizophora mucronata TaxID=61149 RepID=A0A2P2P9F4_RHIMU